MFRSLFVRLIVAYFVIILATLVALSLFLTSFFMEYTFNTRTRQLLREARALNEHVEMYALGWISREYLVSHFEVIDRFLNTSIWITDELGIIWLPYSPAKEQEERWMEQKLTEEEFVQVLKGGTIIKTGRFGERFPNPVLTVGVPLDIAGNIRGGIFLHSPVEGIRRTLADVYGNVWRASIMSAFLAIVLVYWISRVISKPLLQINDISREFALGNFKRRVKVTAKDEIGQLAKNFNAMADSLVSKEENISKSTQQVEICFEAKQCFVEADPDRIEQVIQNLVDNAVN